MRLWDDMQDKYAFADGESTPDGAEIYRAVYVQAVNTLAAQLASTVRAVAYDRPGFHNGCLIRFHHSSDLEAHGITAFMLPLAIDAEVAEPDEAMQEAIR